MYTDVWGFMHIVHSQIKTTKLKRYKFDNVYM